MKTHCQTVRNRRFGVAMAVSVGMAVRDEFLASLVRAGRTRGYEQ